MIVIISYKWVFPSKSGKMTPKKCHFCFAVLVMKQDKLRENQKTLLAARWNLTILNHTLGSENENLRRDHDNLTVQFDNLTRSYAALESKITNLTAENLRLKTRSQKLDAQRKDLTAKIQDMETQRNELNASQAQWSIDAYCPPKHEGMFRTH